MRGAFRALPGQSGDFERLLSVEAHSQRLGHSVFELPDVSGLLLDRTLSNQAEEVEEAFEGFEFDGSN